MQTRDTGHVIVAGKNYGQGSSREHAALAPRFLGLRVVVALQFARIHRENLVNFGVLPLEFIDPEDHGRVEQGDFFAIDGLHAALRERRPVQLVDYTRGLRIPVAYELSPRQIEMLFAGGLIPLMRRRFEHAA